MSGRLLSHSISSLPRRLRTGRSRKFAPSVRPLSHALKTRLRVCLSCDSQDLTMPICHNSQLPPRLKSLTLFRRPLAESPGVWGRGRNETLCNLLQRTKPLLPFPLSLHSPCPSDSLSAGRISPPSGADSCWKTN